MSDLFLLDSDIFISSYRTHHPFSYKEFHSFWRWLEKLASERKVLLLDSVYKEITHKNSKGQIDELGQWAEAIFSERQISHKTDEIGVVPEKLRTLDHGRPWSDDQFASTRLSSNRDMSR